VAFVVPKFLLTGATLALVSFISLSVAESFDTLGYLQPKEKKRVVQNICVKG
jgi:hypothetical protein